MEYKFKYDLFKIPCLFGRHKWTYIQGFRKRRCLNCRREEAMNPATGKWEKKRLDISWKTWYNGGD